MSRAAGLSVFGHAMLTAVGADGPATCAAMRAGINGARRAKLWDFTVGEDLNAARPRLHQWWEGPTMTAPLAIPVITQCAQRAAELGMAPAATGALALPVLVILPPADRPFRAPDLEPMVMSDLARHWGGALPAGSGTIAGGRTGILTALQVADDLIGRHGAPGCIIVGVESFLRQVVVAHYMRRRRLKCGTNSNGFLPGEAACAVLVGRSGAFDADELLIQGIGVGREASGDGGNENDPVLGDGLTQAMQQALEMAQVPFFDLNFTVSDHNGERFKFKEAAIAAGRLDRLPPEGVSRRPKGHVETWHPAQSIGEVGAAIFPCLLGWAFEAGAKAYAPSHHTLLHAGEDNGERVALVTAFERRG